MSDLVVRWSRILPFEAFNRDLKLLFISNFIGAIGDGLYVYLLPLYLRGLQASSAEVGLLYSILTVSMALTIIPGGFFADRFDRKKVMILGWAVWVPIPLMFSVSTHWTQLIPAMSLYGFFLSGPATSAYVMTAARRDKVTITYTTISASWWLGYIFSPGIGGYISTAWNFQVVFLIAFLLYAAATIVLFFINGQRAQKPKITTEKTRTRSWNLPYAKKIILLSLFFSAVFFFLSLVRPLVVQFFQDVYKFESFQIGLLGSVGFLGSAVFSIGLGRIGDRRGKMISAAIALLVGSLAFALFTVSSNMLLLVVASFFYGSSYMLWSLMGACVGCFTPEESRGKWISLSQMLAISASSIAPFVGGLLYESSPYLPFYIVVGVSPILALLALSRVFKEEKPVQTNVQ
jgi:MFS family permease